MSSAYLGEIRIFAGSFAPVGWNFCDGSLLDPNAYTSLFNLIGTTYGGDGVTTFAVPDLRGRLPLHADNSTYTLGQTGGVETVTLTTAQMPSHTHPIVADNNPGTLTSPSNAYFANTAPLNVYAPQSGSVRAPLLKATAMTPQSEGGSQPHDNFQPYLCLSFIMSLFGAYPSAT